MNGRFHIAIHILTLLEYSEESLLSSDYIAGSVNANPALIRKELAVLNKAGLVSSKGGKTGGYAISKPATYIKLADIYQAINQQSVMGIAKNIPNPDCPVGKQINQNINELYAEIDSAMLAKLGSVTLADFVKKFS